MQFKIPKDTNHLAWTRHAIDKMRYYGISEQKVRSVLARHVRTEEGVAPRTIAVMQPAGSKKNPKEIWVMYQETKAKPATSNEKIFQKKKKIITAWRYPGKSPVRNPIPEDIIDELSKMSYDQ